MVMYMMVSFSLSSKVYPKGTLSNPICQLTGHNMSAARMLLFLDIHTPNSQMMKIS